MSIAIFQVTAVESPATKVLVGHKPTVSDIVIVPAKPKVGDNVTVSWTYRDADNDLEADSSVSWLISGLEVKTGTEKSYTLPTDSAGKSLEVAVRPVSAATAFPREGYRGRSASVVIATLGDLCRPGQWIRYKNALWTFDCPGTKLVTQKEAAQICKDRKMLLPEAVDLKTVVNSFKPSGASEPGNTMCEKHGWPLQNACGGGNQTDYNYYWGRTPNRMVNIREDGGPFTITGDRKALFTCWLDRPLNQGNSGG